MHPQLYGRCKCIIMYILLEKKCMHLDNKRLANRHITISINKEEERTALENRKGLATSSKIQKRNEDNKVVRNSATSVFVNLDSR